MDNKNTNHPVQAGEAVDQRALAPWSDFRNQPIRHGDRLKHPDGATFVAVRLAGYNDEGDAWRAVYDYDPQHVSRLCLQIGDKGRATLAPVAAQQANDCNKCLQNGHWCAKDSCTGPAQQAAAVAAPDGWKVERVGSDIHLTRADGKWCGYSMEIDSPAHRLTYEFLAAMLASGAAVAAPSNERILQIAAEVGLKVRTGQGAIKFARALLAAAATTSEDARDAARYRWLRKQHQDGPNTTMHVRRWTGAPAKRDLDDAIDSAMRATQQEGE